MTFDQLERSFKEDILPALEKRIAKGSHIFTVRWGGRF